jgi:uncharacterized protein YlxW (UPF0749 family)
MRTIKRFYLIDGDLYDGRKNKILDKFATVQELEKQLKDKDDKIKELTDKLASVTTDVKALKDKKV